MGPDMTAHNQRVVGVATFHLHVQFLVALEFKRPPSLEQVRLFFLSHQQVQVLHEQIGVLLVNALLDLGHFRNSI